MHSHFINGQWVEGLGHAIDSTDPAKNQIIWTGKSASSEQVDAAIDAARAAFDEWSALSLDERYLH